VVKGGEFVYSKGSETAARHTLPSDVVFSARIPFLQEPCHTTRLKIDAMYQKTPLLNVTGIYQYL
jgi:hypothetical protein